MKYFIYIIKAGITALSENTESQIKMTVRSQKTTNTGDRIIGFCENPISEYRYLFNSISMSNGKITLSKIIQILNGVKSNSILPNIDNKIKEEIVSGNDLVEISSDEYETIENAILEKIGESLGKNTSKDKEFSSSCQQKSDISFEQIIYYGVPGSGKSHKIDEELQAKIPNKEEREQQSMRVVFHPEYTNADFVGQILPVQTENGLEYPFKAGPFTRILKRALKNPDKPYYLIIEEINRGNAAAIFGDLFQLLDRGSDGWSSYSIENLDINAFIRSENERHSDKNPPKTKQVGNIEYTENTSIRLPPNLSLYATMNTSDQNVFTLDNAFQRRWDMQLVKNECEDENQMDATITVNNKKITWKDFQETINAVIGEKSNEGGLSSMEDKRLGCWFVKAENGEIKASVFADKVLKYLWDDAFKFYHQEMFKGGIKNFEELHKTFLAEGFSVFSDECRLGEKFQSADTSTDSESDSE